MAESKYAGMSMSPFMKERFETIDRLEADIESSKGKLEFMATKVELEQLRTELKESEKWILIRGTGMLGGYITILILVIKFFWP